MERTLGLCDSRLCDCRPSWGPRCHPALRGAWPRGRLGCDVVLLAAAMKPDACCGDGDGDEEGRGDGEVEAGAFPLPRTASRKERGEGTDPNSSSESSSSQRSSLGRP